MTALYIILFIAAWAATAVLWSSHGFMAEDGELLKEDNLKCKRYGSSK